MSECISPDKVFAPGNLVHGTYRTVFDFESYFTKGICPGELVGNRVYTPELICFGLLGNEDLADRYLSSAHYGPKIKNEYYSADDIKVAFIISREKVLQAFPGRVFAVGYSFWNHSFWNRIRYGQPLGFSVNDIPVKHPGNSTVLKDEIRIYPPKKSSRPNQVAVQPDAYLGLVTLPHYAPSILDQLNSFSLKTPLPVFSPKCELLGTSN